MAKNTLTNRFVKGLLALSAGFLLASCDPVRSLPSNHSEKIVINNDTSNINVKDNDLLQIYNLVESGKNEEVVDILLREIAEKKFGTFKEFYNSASSDTARDKFISDHKDYFKEDEYKVKRYNDFVEDILDRISESFYNEITSGSYNDEDGKFSEEKLYNSKRYDLYDLHKLNVENEADKAVIDNKFYVDKELTKENAFEQLKGTYWNLEDGKRGYIEEKVYPEILKNKFVESYIYDNNPSSLGRAYARKIKYVKVSYEEEFAPLWKMLKAYAREYIEDAETVAECKAQGKDTYELIASAVKGFTTFDETCMVDVITKAEPATDGAAVAALLEEAYDGEADKYIEIDAKDAAHYKYGTSITIIQPGKYYRGTKIGKLIESYQDAIKAEKDGRFATSTQLAELEKFTADGKPKEYGLMQKVISLAKEDYTTDGWFLKNGGATELPSSIRDRLFNIKVANILDDAKKLPVETGTGIGKYDTKNYVRNINGIKLMLSSEASTYEDEHFNYIHQDVDGKAFYICEVEEAPSTAKLNKDSATAYKEGDKVNTWKIEQLSRKVAKILGTKDSYIKDAYTDMLQNYEFKFYDSSLFDYLNEEYPDLELDD